MRKTARSVVKKILRLRKRNRLSLTDIAARVGAGRSVVARVLKDHPLTKAESAKVWRDKVAGKRRVVADLSGQRFGRLVTVNPDFSPRKKHDTYWRCICDCGKEKLVTSYHLRNGVVKSCGCFSRDSSRERLQKDPYKVNLASVILSYKRSALARGIEFNLTSVQCEELFRRPCFYCGSPPQNTRRIHKNQDAPGRDFTFVYSGIDRKDNGAGYTVENSLPCCAQCNYAKGDYTFNEFMAWIDRLYEYRRERR